MVKVSQFYLNEFLLYSFFFYIFHLLLFPSFLFFTFFFFDMYLEILWMYLPHVSLFFFFFFLSWDNQCLFFQTDSVRFFEGFGSFGGFVSFFTLSGVKVSLHLFLPPIFTLCFPFVIDIIGWGYIGDISNVRNSLSKKYEISYACNCLPSLCVFSVSGFSHLLWTQSERHFVGLCLVWFTVYPCFSFISSPISPFFFFFVNICCELEKLYGMDNPIVHC